MQPTERNDDHLYYDIGLRIRSYETAALIATLVFSTVGPRLQVESIGDNEYGLEMHSDYDKATRTTVFDFARGALAALQS